MVLTKYLKSTLIKKIIAISIIYFLFSLLLAGCNNNKYPNPSNEYYVNDFARALHPTTKNAIVIEGERLYEDTKDIETIGGAQIVFATFLIENIDEIAKYNITDLFRQWQIGKNDMGILVVMFFTESVEDDITYVTLEQTQIEVGYRMEQYLTAGQQGQLLDKTVYGDDYNDLDMLTGYLLYEILTIVYAEYGYTFEYDMNDFAYELENYDYSYDDYGVNSMNFIFYLLSPYSSFFEKVLYLIIGISFLLGSGFIYSRNRGGGGSSGGYGIFRRR